MRGIALAKELALLGAESALALPLDEIGDATQGWPANSERWTDLAARMQAHLEAPCATRQRLMGELGLSAVDYWLVVCCAAVELHPEAAAAASIIAEDERVHLITPLAFARLMRAACGPPFAATLAQVLGGGTPARLGLLESVEVVTGRPVAQHPLRLRSGELPALLASAPELLAATSSLHVWREPRAERSVYDGDLVAGAGELLRESGALCLRAASPRAGRQFALDLASARGRDALFVRVHDGWPAPTELRRLRHGLLVLDLSAWPAEREFPLAEIGRAIDVLDDVALVVRDSASVAGIPAWDVPSLGSDTSRRVWRLALGGGGGELASRFRVNLEEARAAAREAADTARIEGGPTDDAIAHAVLRQGARRMGRLVTHVRSSAQLSDLVVPDALREQLDDIVGWARHRERVHRDYGLRSFTPLGRGLSCLFSGLPGTGKTFATQCLANALGLNLYRIDLSQVVSKYIGETEKALAQVFEEAEAGHGVLLFDEADALFGKRTDVKDAHDRYANVEVGYLLQRLESFTGIAILTTNLRSNIDSAFVRRLRFVLEFPLPDATRRRSLWEQSLPSPALRAADLDLDTVVERFSISGGHIHNIGVAAAHLAAAQRDGVLTTPLLVRATYRELEKAGLSRSPADFGPLARHLSERSA